MNATMDVPDFSQLPNAYPERPPGDEGLLRRYDLATLRQCLRAPGGVESGDIIGKDSRKRLIAHGLVEGRLDPDGLPRSHVTPWGREVARANTSCIDGSEGYRRHE